jgi:protein tyrosine/serine phosphatase
MLMHASDPTRRFPWRWLLTIVCLAGLAWPAWTLCYTLLLGNVHEVIPGKLYRGAQPSAAGMEALIKKHHIRTVLNVRGCCWPDPWYADEAAVCERLNVNLEDVTFSAVHLPSRDELRILLDVLDRAETPIFVHCRHGSDRTGIAAMAAHLLLDDSTFESAHRQLSMRYGHMPIGKTTMLDRFMKLYADWLEETGQTHSPERFRHWILEEYNGGWCDARFEKVERLFTIPRADEPLHYRVVVRNTSSAAWRFQPTKTAGHHVTFKILNEAQLMTYEGRAGMFERTVAPGESVEVMLIVPPLRRVGTHRLMIDMIEEGHCWFHQTGSELWEEEIVIRE